MIGVEARWRTLERFAGHPAARAKLASLLDALPGLAVVGDRFANAFERAGLGMPDTPAHRGVARLKPHVEGRRRAFPSFGVPEVRHDSCLVRRLVLREPCVAVNPHHRSTDRARVGDEVRTDLLEPRPEIGDKTQEWIAYRSFVALFVRIEPIAIVV